MHDNVPPGRHRAPRRRTASSTAIACIKVTTALVIAVTRMITVIFKASQ